MVKKEKSIKQIEAEVMGDLPDIDVDKNQEKKKGKGKQDELPGMPEKTELQKQADEVISVWEDIKIMQEELNEEKNKLVPLMKAENRFSLTLQDSDGDSVEIKIVTTDEKVAINKKKLKEIL